MGCSLSNVKNTAYSGMLPEYISRFYTYEESHINLVKLAEIARVQLIIDEVINIDGDKKLISCQSGLKIDFDVLSLDIGSSPEKWRKIIDLAYKQPHEKMILTIVGGGAGGVELALSIHHKLSKILFPENLRINLIHRGERITSSHNLSVSKKLTKILEKNNITIYLNQEVKSIDNQKVTLSSGINIDSNYNFLVTQASAPIWLNNSSIETDTKGFMIVKNTLQSVNYPDIFASGDIANIRDYPCPKAGVFAVKQAILLYHNLCHYLTNKPLKLYYPQKNYLNIIGTGNKNAVASWGNLSIESPLIWYGKQYLDYNFMKKFPH